ncbi:MAG: Ppx/GppA family phosphatase [Nitrospirae bacterium]|nr:Ppx/GppA family phosphatase [Nitrospirota bacterium]
MSNSLIPLNTLRSKRLAAVDVGSNTLRLLIADVDGAHRITPLRGAREMTRLGKGMIVTGRLSDDAMERSLQALTGFAGLIREAAPERVVAAATSAVREAANGPEFVARVRTETGLDLRMIDGEEEGRLTSLGAASVLTGDTRDLLIVDIGGGSTEFILVKGGERHKAVSVPLGVVTATERCISGAPATPRDLYELDDYIRGHMAEVRRRLGDVGRVRLVATAGTPTTLAAIDQEMIVYRPERINNYVLPLERVEELHGWLASLGLDDRRRVVGIESGREEVMVAGCAILLRIMQDYHFAAVAVSDSGLREGMIIDLFERMGK